MRAFVSGVWLVAITVFYGIVITLSGLIAPSGRFMLPLGKQWARGILGFSGVTVRYLGEEHGRSHAVQLYMANHTSVLDIPVLAPALPDNLRFLAKSSLKWIPFFGWAMLATRGCIFIARGDHEGAVASLREASARVRRGSSVLVFPEGTRSRDGRLREFKKGPFHLAVQARVPVVPVWISGAARAMPPGAFGIHAGEVIVCFGPPIAVTDQSVAELAAQVRAAIEALETIALPTLTAAPS